jgi:hypothetical protein
MADALASRGDEGRGRLRKAPGRCQTTFDPGMSEWGNPASLCKQMASPTDEFIVRVEPTQGTETSQYLEERKSTETPLVAASESGFSPNRPSGRGCGSREELQRHDQSKCLERHTTEGDSPVGDGRSPPLPSAFQSSTMLVERGVKPGGPPSKAKYSSTTDSAKVGRLKGEKHPF